MKGECAESSHFHNREMVKSEQFNVINRKLHN